MPEIEPDKPEEIKTKLPEKIDYEFAKWLRDNGYSRNTFKNYYMWVKKMLGKRRYISPQKIKSFLSDKNNLVKRSSIKIFLVFLEDKLNIKIEPFRYPRIKKEHKVTETISPEDAMKLIEGIKEDSTKNYKLFDFTMFTKVLFKCGLRISECARIDTTWFNWVKWVNNKTDYGELKIIKAKRNKERIVHVNPMLMQEILDYTAKHEDGLIKKGLLFDFNHDHYIKKTIKKGIRLNMAEARYIEKVCNTYQRMIREVSMKILNKKIHSHILRKCRASELDTLGVSPTGIRDFLGHDNLSTTSVYIYNTSEKLKQQLKNVGA